MSEAKTEPSRGGISGQAMDRVVERRPFWRRRGLVAGVILAAAAGAAWFFFLRSEGGKSLAVAGSNILDRDLEVAVLPRLHRNRIATRIAHMD